MDVLCRRERKPAQQDASVIGLSEASAGEGVCASGASWMMSTTLGMFGDDELEMPGIIIRNLSHLHWWLPPARPQESVSLVMQHEQLRFMRCE